MIKFNKPFLSGNELDYITKAVNSGQTSGNRFYTKACQQYFMSNYGFGKCLLTTSCTDALEMSALLLNIQSGDEVIVPSYTFVSSANAFILRGAKIVFTDSCESNPNIDIKRIEQLITPRTKAVVVVHYAGVACNMGHLLELSSVYNFKIVEDAAQAIDSFYKTEALGSIGDTGTFSFHETKNISCGEGGMLTVNNKNLMERAEIIWEKGTNRKAFYEGKVDKYNWVDIGSSFLPSDITAAYLFGQIENLKRIQSKRIKIWENYYTHFKDLQKIADVQLPEIPEYATNNGHLFYLVCSSEQERALLIEYLNKFRIKAVFHYLSLHKSPYYKNLHDGRVLLNSDKFTSRLIRLPLFYDLSNNQQEKIISVVWDFYKKRANH